MKIRIDREICVGAGMCALAAGAVFVQSNDDGRVILLLEEPAEAKQQEATRQAAYLCPSGAITIEHDE